ncbi:MAG: hypothetical protein CMC55_05975 [Flavobacteriaceae bacterium]|nr:hypothetical protein [Flavobacteriaceae bacterium]|tara:strand:+ start:134 stop:340 length:207 start_codon:yes stop_codon:yes gene_type:complete
MEKVTSKNLLKHAFDTMKMLKKGEIDTEVAKSQANLLKQSNNILKYELDKAIAIQKYENIDIKNIEDQ